MLNLGSSHGCRKSSLGPNSTSYLDVEDTLDLMITEKSVYLETKKDADYFQI